MTALNFQPQFASQIVAKLKPHTLRAERKIPIKPGELLQLYTGLRHKGARLIGEALCLGVIKVRLNVAEQTFAFDQVDMIGGAIAPNYGNAGQFARADGFTRSEELFAFFAPRAEGGIFTGDLIFWGRTFEPAQTLPAVSSEAIDTIRHMTGSKSDTPRVHWGFRNRYCGSAESPTDDIRELAAAGYIRSAGTINEGRDRYWSATIAGMRAAGLPNAAIARTLRP